MSNEDRLLRLDNDHTFLPLEANFSHIARFVAETAIIHLLSVETSLVCFYCDKLLTRNMEAIALDSLDVSCIRERSYHLFYLRRRNLN